MRSNRDQRNLKDEHFYHIYNRGNRRDPIMKELSDLDQYEKILSKSFEKHKQELISYCIMDNHFHLLIRIQDVKKFIKSISLFQSMCSVYYNKKYLTVGHLFQDKYKHREIQNEGDLVNLSRYIHMNPFDENSFMSPELVLSYRYSSLQNYLGKRKNPQIKKNYVLKHFNDINAYFTFLISKSVVQQASCLNSKIFEDYLNQEMNSKNLDLKGKTSKGKAK